MVGVLLYLMMRFGCGAHMAGGGCGHLSHHQHKVGENRADQASSGAALVTRDPVCGMRIEATGAAYSKQYGEDVFYFCSKDCYRKFNEDPERFAEMVRMEKRYIA
jgi:YHS domain-containing protein